MARCEDYPCCGHTPDDPCEPQPYDAPGYYDTSIPGQEHRLCDHENGDCNVYDDAMDAADDDTCEGHENLGGPTGDVVFCDGTCRPAA